MRYRNLGKTEIKASVIGLGTYPIGGWMWGGTDEADAIRTIQASLDAGINLIDTAPMYGYGLAEEIVGKAIRGRRDKAIVATKCGIVWDTDDWPTGQGEFHFYADEKGLTVRNYGISLEIEHKAATQLMNEIQQFSQEELAKKAEAISRIDDHIKAFEASLEELFGMTGRVQENLNRIRDESVFVESTNKKINEVKEKFDQAEKSLLLAERNLAATEERLEEKI